MKFCFFTILLFIVQPLVTAQVIPNFTLTNVADNKPVSLSDFQSCDGLVVLFTSNACPYDGYYRDRVQSLVNTYTGKIQFLLINAHPEPRESIATMKEDYSRWNINAPYLADKEHVALKCLNARRSPEVFLLKRTDKEFTIVYQGAIDDNPQVARDVKRSYLKESIGKLLAGQPIQPAETRPVGCIIRSH